MLESHDCFIIIMYCVIIEIKYGIGSVVISVMILHTFVVESTNLCMCVCVCVCMYVKLPSVGPFSDLCQFPSAQLPL